MAEDVRVTNWPNADSKERVALDLLDRITNAEFRGQRHPDNRQFYLELYGQCLAAVRGTEPAKVEPQRPAPSAPPSGSAWG